LTEIALIFPDIALLTTGRQLSLVRTRTNEVIAEGVRIATLAPLSLEAASLRESWDKNGSRYTAQRRADAIMLKDMAS